MESTLLSIRRYQATDNPSVKALYYAGLQQSDADLRADGYSTLEKDLDDIQNVYIRNNGEFLVGVIGKELVAMGALKKHSTIRGEIKRMSVSRDYQRRGYGKAILTRLIDTAVQYGYKELFLDTTVQNIPARTLYEKFGFVQARQARIGRLDIMFYEKQLS